jgi:hypothetical protein
MAPAPEADIDMNQFPLRQAIARPAAPLDDCWNRNLLANSKPPIDFKRYYLP